ncbi:conserved hypothetical protein [Neospora caninum Liverpool]|uniref:MORN repeat-containing protein n=1 Tax=Neospora caninum (strain Liverpool) TaxID=572307 RepID=F0VD51_NEOCL|nr:conserved hypothetical protein [Neospora caninum Liverpool]CBZ51566.1 conserved hypothetical protein [Neospora caninum Liverpool]CEL65517.1 TPA: MORN repeat-containing protein [Neospora caninum Liverpool]|eukprot:XP_003881599.1 conserved hypothetical protein [Neospora caninum Liverpool]
MASRRVPLFVALCFITIVAQQSIEALGSASAGEPTDTKAAETRCQISSETASSASEPAADQQSFLTARSSSVLENEVAGQGDVEPQEKDGIAQGSGAGHRLPQGSTRRRDQAFAYGGYYSYGAGFPGFMPYGGYGIFGGFPRMPGFGFLF